jgi:hypothetical protein
MTGRVPSSHPPVRLRSEFTEATHHRQAGVTSNAARPNLQRTSVVAAFGSQREERDER